MLLVHDRSFDDLIDGLILGHRHVLDGDLRLTKWIPAVGDSLAWLVFDVRNVSRFGRLHVFGDPLWDRAFARSPSVVPNAVQGLILARDTGRIVYRYEDRQSSPGTGRK